MQVIFIKYIKNRNWVFVCFLGGFLLLIWLPYVWNVYICQKEATVLKRQEKVPNEIEDIYDKDTYNQTKVQVLNHLYGYTIQSWYFRLLATLIIVSNVMYELWTVAKKTSNLFGFRNSKLVSSLAVSVILVSIYMLYNFPLMLSNYIINGKIHWFFPAFVGRFVMYIVFALVATVLLFYTSMWAKSCLFLYVWLFLSVIVISLTMISQKYNSTLINLKNVSDTELYLKLERLASNTDFPINEIYIVKGNMHNPGERYIKYFNINRILLTDILFKCQLHFLNGTVAGRTLVECDTNLTDKDKIGPPKLENMTHVMLSRRYKDNEILAICAHELGHWKKHHFVKALVFNQLCLMFICLICGLVYNSEIVYNSFGFDEDDRPFIIGILITFILIFIPINIDIFPPLHNFVSQSFECEADLFAKSIIGAEHLKIALIKLYEDRNQFPAHDYLYSLSVSTYPSLLRRINSM